MREVNVLKMPARAGLAPSLRHAGRFALWATGLALLLWVALTTQFRDGAGFPTAQVLPPLAGGAALLIIGWAIGRGGTISALWLGVALVGQATTLQLVNAGPTVSYQHYRSLDQVLAEVNPIILAFFVFQISAVLIALAFRGRRILTWLTSSFRPWQLLLFAGAFYLFAAVVSQDIPLFITELIFAGAVQTVTLVTIVMVAWTLPEGASAAIKRRIDGIFGEREGSEQGTSARLDRFALVLAAWAVVLAALLNFFSYQQLPHVPDELAYLIQSRFYAAGTLTVPSPITPDAFEMYLMFLQSDAWFPAPPPGWPLLLSIGTMAGVPWLVNPLLAGASILLSYLLLQEIYSRRTARISVFLLAVSPWYIFLGMSFMTHMSTLTLALLAALTVARSRRTGNLWLPWIGGFALGMMALIRPMEAVTIAVILGLWAVGLGGRRLRAPALLGLVAGAIIIGSATLAYNRTLMGDAKVFPIMAYTDQEFGVNSNALGFGPDRGIGWQLDPNPGHTPVDALINSELNTFAINVELLGWGIGSLLLVAVALFSGRMRRGDYLMLAVIVAVYIPHFFYYFSGGPDFGGRYWFLMIVPLMALTVRGIQVLEERFGSGTKGNAVVMAGVLALSLVALVNFFPWRAVDKYHNYRGIRPDIVRLAEDNEFGRSLVLIRGERHSDYGSAAIHNPLDLQANVPIYAWDRSPEVREQVLEAYADRPVWVIDGATITSGAFEIVAGPITAQEALSLEPSPRP